MESNILNIKSSGLEDYYWYWYCNIPRLGTVNLRRLLAVLKSPEQVYKAEASLLKEAGKLTDKEISSIEESKKDTSVYREFMDIKKKGIHFTYPGKEDYPDRLMIIHYVCTIMESFRMTMYQQLLSLVQDRIQHMGIISQKHLQRALQIWEFRS